MTTTTDRETFPIRGAAATATSVWNDSADPDELRQSIALGAVGATCNPVIALAAIKSRFDHWAGRLRELADQHPTWGESELGWAVVEELSIEAAALLHPIFEATGGRDGRLSIQTDPRLHRNLGALVEQAVKFSALAPNIIVKIPATAVGVAAMEEAAYRGVSINATLSFTVSQAIAVGEALERAMDRRAADGAPEKEFGHVVTIMVGRLDDWIKDWAASRGILTTPGALDWAGVAALKHAYSIFQTRGFRSRVLSAAFRNQLHFTEFVGGDLVISPPFAWQKRLTDNRPQIDPRRIETPVDPAVLSELLLLEEFRRAYEIGGLAPEEFASFGASRKTLRQFLDADAQLDSVVRDILVPAP